MSLPTFARLCSRTFVNNGSHASKSVGSLQATRLYSSESETASLTEGERHIYNKLTNELTPLRLQVADVSGGCGSMYAINIASAQFKGMSVVKQHRKINEILKEEIKEMHGLQ
ncbi:hypothetical protein INT43_004929 [Umbelopsis isabellina]|uniref:Bola-like protein n=1 Tax=Mortierella isabellina TaxID=91625 RepID=A0A8H7U8P9_MORIS|nr:hypothetical protein INT43_004929 [Umbelopsis isabellina]